jgi:hypothetical protein
MDTLQADFRRYQRLHSWYKHNPLSGRDFYMYQAVGERPRNSFDSSVQDISGLHWHFVPVGCANDTDLKQATGPIHTVNFGPFLRGDNHGLHLICESAGDTFLPWITKHYPEWSHIDWQSDNINQDIVTQLYEREVAKYWANVVKVTHPIQPTGTFRTFLQHLLKTNKLSFDKCAVTFNNLKSTNGFCGDFVTFTSPDDYPEVFTRYPIDIEGVEVGISGGFGDILCVYTGNKWSVRTYHRRIYDAANTPQSPNAVTADHVYDWTIPNYCVKCNKMCGLQTYPKKLNSILIDSHNLAFR